MHNGICPMCGSAEVYSKNDGVGGRDQFTIKPYWKNEAKKLFKTAWHSLKLTTLMCKQCAYVALYVAPEDRIRIPDLFEAGKWTHVKPTEQPHD